MIFRRFPYTTLNDINLDWIIKQVKQIAAALQGKQDKPDAAGTAGQVLGLDGNLDPVWIDQSGGGTNNYNDLTNKPQINSIILSGNKTAADLGLANASDIPGYSLQLPVMDGEASAGTSHSRYAMGDHVHPTDTSRASNSVIGIVITGARPAASVTPGQYVIVRDSTITGITDGLYTAVSALSPSTDVTAADLTPVGGGGFNDLQGAFKSRFLPGTLSDLNELGTSARPLLFAIYDAQTLNTPYKEGITTFTAGTVFHISSSSNYSCQMVLCAGDTSIYMRRKNINGWGSWTKITPV